MPKKRFWDIFRKSGDNPVESLPLPPAPRSFIPDDVIVGDDGLFGDVEEIQNSEPTLHDGRKVPPLRGKSGTITGIPAYCPICNDGNEGLTETRHQLLGYLDDFTRVCVKCTVCGHEHEILFAPKCSG